MTGPAPQPAGADDLHAPFHRRAHGDRWGGDQHNDQGSREGSQGGNGEDVQHTRRHDGRDRRNGGREPRPMRRPMMRGDVPRVRDEDESEGGRAGRGRRAPPA